MSDTHIKNSVLTDDLPIVANSKAISKHAEVLGTPFVWDLQVLGVKVPVAGQRKLAFSDELEPSQLEILQFRHDKAACKPHCPMCHDVSQERRIPEAEVRWEKIAMCFGTSREDFKRMYPEYDDLWVFRPDTASEELTDSLELSAVDIAEVGIPIALECVKCVVIDADAPALITEIAVEHAQAIEASANDCIKAGIKCEGSWKVFFHDSIVEMIDNACGNPAIMPLSMICAIAKLVGVTDAPLSVARATKDSLYVQKRSGQRQTAYDWVRAFVTEQGNFQAGRNRHLTFGAYIAKDDKARHRDTMHSKTAYLTPLGMRDYERTYPGYPQQVPIVTPEAALTAWKKRLLAISISMRMDRLAALSIGWICYRGYCWSLFFNEEYVLYLRDHYQSVITLAKVIELYEGVNPINRGKRKFYIYFNEDGILHASVDRGGYTNTGDARLPSEWIHYFKCGKLLFGNVANMNFG